MKKEVEKFFKIIEKETKRWAGFGFIVVSLILPNGKAPRFVYNPTTKKLHRFKITGGYFKDSLLLEGEVADYNLIHEAFANGFVQITFYPKEKYQDTYYPKVLFQGGKIAKLIKK